MKLALLADGVSPYVLGGMQRHSANLAIHLARLGVDVTLFHTAYDAAAIEAAKDLTGWPEDARRHIHNAFVAPPRQRRYPAHYLAESHDYSRHLLQRFLDDECQADFIYAQGLTSWAFLAHKQRRRRLPPVGVNMHGYSMFQRAGNARAVLEYAMYRPVFRSLTRKADYVFSFSGKIRDIVQSRIGVPAERIIEIPNGIEPLWLVDQPPPSRDVRTFLFVGRYERLKGVQELHSAISGLPNGCPMRFEMVGSIPESARLNHPLVTYHGTIKDADRLKQLYDASDFLICPSYAEGMPTVILEAMARGLAVIATDVGATRELVGSDNGFLIDSPRGNELPLTLQAAMRLPAENVDAMRRRSLERARAYSWDAVAAATVAAIEARL